MTAFTLIMKAVEQIIPSKDVWHCGRGKTELSKEQKCKSSNEASKQITDCHSMKKNTFSRDQSKAIDIVETKDDCTKIQ